MSHYEASHLTVEYNQGLDAIVMNWHGFAEGEKYRKGLDAGLDLVQKQGAQNWLADLRDMGTVSQADQEWSNQEWFPRALETSLTNMAIVQPEDVVADMSVDNIMQEIDGGTLKTHYFDNRNEAEQWLQE
jgi:hypothetical protein